MLPKPTQDTPSLCSFCLKNNSPVGGTVVRHCKCMLLTADSVHGMECLLTVFKMKPLADSLQLLAALLLKTTAGSCNRIAPSEMYTILPAGASPCVMPSLSTAHICVMWSSVFSTCYSLGQFKRVAENLSSSHPHSGSAPNTCTALSRAMAMRAWCPPGCSMHCHHEPSTRGTSLVSRQNGKSDPAADSKSMLAWYELHVLTSSDTDGAATGVRERFAKRLR